MRIFGFEKKNELEALVSTAKLEDASTHSPGDGDGSCKTMNILGSAI